MDAPLVTISGLTVRYGAVCALDGLDLAVPRGAVGLLGPNGAGKTTLIRALLGQLVPPPGVVSILGHDPARRSGRAAIRQSVGYMPERDAVLPGMTGLEIVATLARLSGLARVDAMSRAHEVLDYVRIEEERYRESTGYSTGLRQRLKLAQALAHDPAVLLLDEPTNGLDPKARVQLLGLIRDLVTKHEKSLILCSHLLPDVERLCEHVVVLAMGRVLRNARLAELLARGERRVRVVVRGEPSPLATVLQAQGMRVESGSDGALIVHLAADADSVDPILAAAAGERAAISGIEELRPSLEEVFLGLVEGRTGVAP